MEGGEDEVEKGKDEVEKGKIDEEVELAALFFKFFFLTTGSGIQRQLKHQFELS